ncbi:MAG: saccharopine dehydrogenase family protein [Candidatus Aminicenantaceae bacterium]
MPKFLVLGAGKMGVVLAKDLILSNEQNIVTLADISFERLKKARNFIPSDRLITLQRDVEDKNQREDLFKGQDVAISALLHKHSFLAMEASILHGVNLVDVVGEGPLERLSYDEEAKRKGVTIIPGCGLAPGIDNICVGRGVYLLDDTEKAMIYVGGNPLHPQPPLKYSIVYAAESLLDFYERKAIILEKGKIKEVEALSGIEPVEFPPPFSRMECFYTDGLSSLIYTLQGRIRDKLAEKTVRYPGHAQAIKMIKEFGFFSREPLSLFNKKVIPREFLKAILETKWKLGKEGDVTLMRVVVSGKKSGEPTTHIFEIIDFYDPKMKYTSMAKTTSFPASIAAQMIASDKITQRGVLFPENVFHGELYQPIVNALQERGVVVSHRIEKNSKH